MQYFHRAWSGYDPGAGVSPTFYNSRTMTVREQYTYFGGDDYDDYLVYCGRFIHCSANRSHRIQSHRPLTPTTTSSLLVLFWWRMSKSGIGPVARFAKSQQSYSQRRPNLSRCCVATHHIIGRLLIFRRRQLALQHRDAGYSGKCSEHVLL
jgi:hypothetical protein